ncbi:hypothetical protein ACWFMI_18245 [Nocardiopsis terrae]
MNPNPPPPGGGEFGLPPQGPPPGPPWNHPPAGPPAPPPSGRYGTGLLAVLSVIAVLAGASFLGGGLALTGALTDRIAADRGEGVAEPSASPSSPPPPEESPSPTRTPLPPPEPTGEPSGPPTEEPREKVSAEDVVAELGGDYELRAGVDITGELCEDEEDAFVCTSAVDTDLVRIIAFENVLVASIVITGLTAQIAEDDNDMVDAQNACHIVFIWFEGGGMEQSERDDMAGDTEEFAGC